eukprot:CAMPEP_0182478532 /NCGR_PEP_ID=MMETSP1319-20130603/32635_1 /TAXON_ID=172717 /ORGANISM="Bolidomonas pacifica, Strain RCC208" /LENGTH=93 /DNA_ID=CAMNT_0024679879 /DNA_START=89 /DNA_END=367 /DNA_ORIENTATION=+
MASLSSEDQASALMHLSSSLAAFSSEKPPTSSSLAGQYHAGRSLGFVQKKMKKNQPPHRLRGSALSPHARPHGDRTRGRRKGAFRGGTLAGDE